MPVVPWIVKELPALILIVGPVPVKRMSGVMMTLRPEPASSPNVLEEVFVIVAEDPGVVD